MALRVIDWTALAAGAGSGPAGLAALISGLLVRGELRPGDRLPSERDFAELLGTSRATVREAIHELELKGVVDRRRGRGTVITPDTGAADGLLGALETDQRGLHDVQDLRATVEPAIAARAARNPLLAELVETSAERIRDARARAHRLVAARRKSHAGHREVLRAIERGDHDAAADAMSAHLRYASTRLA